MPPDGVDGRGVGTGSVIGRPGSTRRPACGCQSPSLQRDGALAAFVSGHGGGLQPARHDVRNLTHEPARGARGARHSRPRGRISPSLFTPMLVPHPRRFTPESPHPCSPPCFFLTHVGSHRGMIREVDRRCGTARIHHPNPSRSSRAWCRLRTAWNKQALPPLRQEARPRTLYVLQSECGRALRRTDVVCAKRTPCYLVSASPTSFTVGVPTRGSCVARSEAGRRFGRA